LSSKVSEKNMNEVELIQRFREVERKVNFLLSELGLEEKYRSYNPPAPGMEDVQQLLRQGKVLQAIQLYRQKTGAGLSEAKAAVESMKY